MRSAAHVAGRGEDLAVGHMSSDHRIQAAQSGWQGESALALGATMDGWLETSRALLSRIGDHARGLHQAAAAHAAAEEERARALAHVGACGDGMASERQV